MKIGSGSLESWYLRGSGAVGRYQWVRVLMRWGVVWSIIRTQYNGQYLGKKTGWVTVWAYTATPGHLIGIAVIKQSVFDRQLSDTGCVQALGLLVEESTKTCKTLLLAKFSLLELALHQQLFIRDFLALHSTTSTQSSELRRTSSALSLSLTPLAPLTLY